MKNNPEDFGWMECQRLLDELPQDHPVRVRAEAENAVREAEMAAGVAKFHAECARLLAEKPASPEPRELSDFRALCELMLEAEREWQREWEREQAEQPAPKEGAE